MLILPRNIRNDEFRKLSTTSRNALAEKADILYNGISQQGDTVTEIYADAQKQSVLVFNLNTINVVSYVIARGDVRDYVSPVSGAYHTGSFLAINGADGVLSFSDMRTSGDPSVAINNVSPGTLNISFVPVDLPNVTAPRSYLQMLVRGWVTPVDIVWTCRLQVTSTTNL